MRVLRGWAFSYERGTPVRISARMRPAVRTSHAQGRVSPLEASPATGAVRTQPKDGSLPSRQALLRASHPGPSAPSSHRPQPSDITLARVQETRVGVLATLVRVVPGEYSSCIHHEYDFSPGHLSR